MSPPPFPLPDMSPPPDMIPPPMPPMPMLIMPPASKPDSLPPMPTMSLAPTVGSLPPMPTMSAQMPGSTIESLPTPLPTVSPSPSMSGPKVQTSSVGTVVIPDTVSVGGATEQVGSSVPVNALGSSLSSLRPPPIPIGAPGQDVTVGSDHLTESVGGTITFSYFNIQI